MDHRTVQQPVTDQIDQRLQVITALDDPACQGVAWDGYAMALQHLLEAVQRQAVGVLGRQQHGQHTGAGHAFLDQLGRLVGSNRGRFTTLAGVDLADMADNSDLHRDDFQLLAGFFADSLLAQS